MSVFVAYKSKDIQLVANFVENLQRYTDNCEFWFAPFHLRAGNREEISETILRQIDLCDQFLYCLGSDDLEPEQADEDQIINLAKEAERALQRQLNDPDFRIILVRLLPDALLPARFEEARLRISYDLSTDLQGRVFRLLTEFLDNGNGPNSADRGRSSF